MPGGWRLVRDQLQFSDQPKEIGMGVTVCVVCRGQAEEGYQVGHFVDFKCPDCGFYSVNCTLLREMEQSKLRFNVERARHFIAVHSKSGSVAAIDRIGATFHQLIG